MNHDLQERDFSLLNILADMATNNLCFPGYDAIAPRLGYRDPASVADSLRRLETAGRIERAGKGQRSTILLTATGHQLKAGMRDAGKRFKRRPAITLCAPRGNADSYPRPEPVPGLTFNEVTDVDGCRYPYGDRDYTFCGKARKHRSDYCPDHHGVCYLKPGETQATRERLHVGAQEIPMLDEGEDDRTL
jgi:hypothetical protein